MAVVRTTSIKAVPYADQAVDFGGHVERAVQRRDACTGKALPDARVGGEGCADFWQPAAKLAHRDHGKREDGGGNRARAGAEQSGLYRIAHQEKSGEYQRDAADPDRQLAADETFEIEIVKRRFPWVVAVRARLAVWAERPYPLSAAARLALAATRAGGMETSPVWW